MATAQDLRRLAMALGGVVEKPHFDRRAFVAARTFATLAADEATANIRFSPDEQALLDRPIADLNLSVRARKCMIRLGLNTVGELLRRTGDDLLECKNFGVTSLNEVREKPRETEAEAAPVEPIHSAPIDHPSAWTRASPGRRRRSRSA